MSGVHLYKNISCTTCNKEVPTVFHPWVEFCTVWQGKLKWSWTCNAQVFTLHIFRRQAYNCLFHDHELSGGILRGNKKAPPDRDETIQNLSRAMSRSKKMWMACSSGQKVKPLYIPFCVLGCRRTQSEAAAKIWDRHLQQDRLDDTRHPYGNFGVKVSRPS